MLSPEIVKKIKKIHIKSGRRVNTMMAGQYKSIFRGAGIEFEEVREYTPGDEVKNIDWKVSARLGKPFIKLYREERELVVMLLVDMSASGRFGTTDSIKMDTAAEIASILAFNAIRNNDKVGALLFTDRVEKYIPPKKGSSHVWRVIKEFFAFEPQNRGTDIRNAVSYLGRVSRKRTISFLISDFITGNYAHELKVASKKHELIGILMSDPGEFRLPKAGIVSVNDLENGEILTFDASDRETRRKFRKQKELEYRSTRETLKASDIDCIEISTAGSVAESLTRYFELRKKRL
jgi:uncharacterized protein (DUF58 family)